MICNIYVRPGSRLQSDLCPVNVSQHNDWRLTGQGQIYSIYYVSVPIVTRANGGFRSLQTKNMISSQI